MKNTFGIALTKCFFCGGDSDIIMNTKLTKKHAEAVENLHGKVVSEKPCSKCEQHMKEGIILISVDEEKTTDHSNPYRTGGFFVVNESAIKRIFDSEMHESLISNRIGWIEHKTAERLGLFELANQNGGHNENNV